jgi:hypothetical protein
MLIDATLGLQQGIEPPALDANMQRVRAAGVLLEKTVRPQDWAREHLEDGLNQPVYTL